MNKIKITEENYKGYIKLYEHNEYIDFPGTKIFVTFLGAIMAWVILNTVLLLVNPIFLYSMIFGSLAICGAAISNIVINRIKTKKELKKKYPFINYSVKQKELSELLTKNNLLYHNKDTNTYIIYKAGYLKLFDEEENEIEHKNSVEEIINHYNQEILTNEEEKPKVKTLNYKR